MLEQGQIIDTIVYSIAHLLDGMPAEVSAFGMLVVQTVCNFFIPSGSGQAYVTMPLMTPLSDLVEVPRQVAVMAYQMGDGFTNMIIPTNAILMGILGVAGISYASWFRFCLPLIVKLYAAGAVVLVLAVICDLA